MENKKAQGLPVSTIILLVIGVIILVVLVLGFTLGWSNLKSWIAPSNNVQTIVDQCNLNCQLDQKYNFCSENKTLKTSDITIETTCNDFATIATYSSYGIKKCPGITCERVNNEEETN